MLDEFRALFGDERADYAAAISQHYSGGPPAGWDANYVSAYASAHPWEDWAETWAHYLHMVATLRRRRPQAWSRARQASRSVRRGRSRRTTSIGEETFDALLERWIPLTLAMNNLNRSMGHADFYPFVIPAAAVKKLAFVHRAIRDRQVVQDEQHRRKARSSSSSRSTRSEISAAPSPVAPVWAAMGSPSASPLCWWIRLLRSKA